MDMRSLNTALDRFKDSFLVAAAKAGSLEEVASLLDIGANVNWVSLDGVRDTPLLAACRNGHKTVASMLLSHGADPKTSDSSGETALHFACRRGDEVLAKMLLQNGVDFTAVNSEGRTAFDAARSKGYVELAAKLDLMAIRCNLNSAGRSHVPGSHIPLPRVTSSSTALPSASSAFEGHDDSISVEIDDDDDEEDDDDVEDDVNGSMTSQDVYNDYERGVGEYATNHSFERDESLSEEDRLLADARESALLDFQADALAAAARLHYQTSNSAEYYTHDQPNSSNRSTSRQELNAGDGESISELASRISGGLRITRNNQREGSQEGGGSGDVDSMLPPIGRWRGMTASLANHGASTTTPSSLNLPSTPTRTGTSSSGGGQVTSGTTSSTPRQNMVSISPRPPSSSHSSGSHGETSSANQSVVVDPLHEALQWTNQSVDGSTIASHDMPISPAASSLPTLVAASGDRNNSLGSGDMRNTRPLSARPPNSSRQSDNSRRPNLISNNMNRNDGDNHQLLDDDRDVNLSDMLGRVNQSTAPTSRGNLSEASSQVIDDQTNNDDDEQDNGSGLLSGREAEQFNHDLIDASSSASSTPSSYSTDQLLVMQRLWKLSRRELKSALAKAEATRAQSSRVWNELMASQVAEDRIRSENVKLCEELQMWSGNAVKGCSLEDLEELESKMKEALFKVSTEKEKRIKEKLFDEREQRVCVVCQEGVKSVLLLPCRHLCLCGPCSSRQELTCCPLCRAEISDRISVYS